MYILALGYRIVNGTESANLNSLYVEGLHHEFEYLLRKIKIKTINIFDHNLSRQLNDRTLFMRNV